MRARGNGVLRLAVPIKAAAQRFAFLLLAAAAAGLLVLGKADVVLIERLRVQAADIAAPVLGVIRQPVGAARHLAGTVRELWYLREDNLRLREENARLLRWQDMARRYEQDNARYRRLLHVAPDPLTSFVSARLVGDSGGSFVRTALLNAGAREGVQKGQAVIAETGLVGRVVEVGQQSARVLLLTDLNSRIPVLFEEARYRAVLAGDNTDQPRVEFLPTTAQVSPGDRLVTSGHGGLFPPGLPVGVVASVTERSVRVQPFTEWHRLDMVSIVRYEVPRPEPYPEGGERFGGRR